MFQAYVVIATKKQANLVDASPYTMVIRNGDLFLEEISKEDIQGVFYYLLEELTPSEIYLFRDSITVVGVNSIIRQRKLTLKK